MSIIDGEFSDGLLWMDLSGHLGLKGIMRGVMYVDVREMEIAAWLEERADWETGLWAVNSNKYLLSDKCLNCQNKHSEKTANK